MSFSTFVRNSSSPLPKFEDIPPELPPRQPPPKKRSYVNLIVGPDGPVEEQDGGANGQRKQNSKVPPPIPPRRTSTLTTHSHEPSPEPISSQDRKSAEVPTNGHVEFTAPAPIASHPPATHNSHFVVLNDRRSPSPPPPAKLGSIDPSLEFMKSLEDLTSIGSFVGSDVVASPLEGKESKEGTNFTLDMNASLDDLVAALSEMESSLQTLEETNKGSPPQVRPEPEKRRISSADAATLLEDTNIDNLEDALQGFIRDTSPVDEVEKEVKAALQSPQCQQQLVEEQAPPPNARQSREYSDLISSLQSVGSEGEQDSGQGEGDLVSSLRALGGEGNGTVEGERADLVAALVDLGGGQEPSMQSKPGKPKPPVAPKPSLKPTVAPKPKLSSKNGLGKSM